MLFLQIKTAALAAYISFMNDITGRNCSIVLLFTSIEMVSSVVIVGYGFGSFTGFQLQPILGSLLVSYSKLR